MLSRSDRTAIATTRWPAGPAMVARTALSSMPSAAASPVEVIEVAAGCREMEQVPAGETASTVTSPGFTRDRCAPRPISRTPPLHGGCRARCRRRDEFIHIWIRGRPAAPRPTATPRTRRRSPPGHCVLLSSSPAGRPAWRPSRDPRNRGQQRGTRPGRPERARACLAGEAGAAAAADYAHDRPRPGESSRRVIDRADRPDAPSAGSGPAGSPGPAHARETAGTAPWLPLCQAPEGGADVTGLARMTRRARTRLDRHRRRYRRRGPRDRGQRGTLACARARGRSG